jgi:hypothetical protein
LNLAEQVRPVLCDEAAPERLGVLPQDLDAIELGAIGRQIVQMQVLFRPLASLLVHRVALVYAGVVDQNDSRNLVRLRRDLVEKRDYIFTCCRSLLSSPSQPAIAMQSSKHVHALPMREQRDGSGLAYFPPAVLHWGFGLKPDSSKYSSSHRCS